MRWRSRGSTTKSGGGRKEGMTGEDGVTSINIISYNGGGGGGGGNFLESAYQGLLSLYFL